MRSAHRAAAALLIGALATACVFDPSPTATPGATADASVGASRPATTEPTPTAAATGAPHSASPSPTPEPTLSLDPPEASDPRVVSASVVPEVTADGGQITVTVTSAADERIDEIVLRWPVELSETLFLAPFRPSPERIAEGGSPLVQAWTKWVVGPGEHGEPAGTISLGYGPLMPGATLTIPLYVTRAAPGPVAFDLQLLAGNDLLSFDGREPAELRVEVP